MSLSLRLGTGSRAPLPSPEGGRRQGPPSTTGSLADRIVARAAPRRMAHPAARRSAGAAFGRFGRAAAAVVADLGSSLGAVGAPTARVVGRTRLAGRPIALGAAILIGVVGLAVAGRAAGLVAPDGIASAGDVAGPATMTTDQVGGGWPPPPPATIAVDPLDLGAKLALVGLLMYLALRLLRHLVAPTALRSGPIVVLATRALGPKSALHLVAIGERRLLVGESPAGLVGLTELAAEELEPPLEPSAGVAGNSVPWEGIR